MRLQEPRISPLPSEQWGPDVLEALAALTGGGAGGGEGESELRVVNALATLANHPALAKAFLGFNRHLLFETTLSDRDRELVILRVGWLCRSDYEWAQHVVLARRAGLSDTEIRRVQDGPAASEWDEDDAVLLRAVDELHADAFVGDDTWSRLAARFDERELMDLIFTVGVYTLLAMVFNSLGIPLDAGLEANFGEGERG